MIGLGYYDTITPSVIERNVLENPCWYTAYTPYQPEISQGRLEALINFQTMVTDLTGLATANASMLDESTAVVEGMLLARRASDSDSNVFLVDADALPQTMRVLADRAEAVGIELADRVDLEICGSRRACRTRSACSCSTRAPRDASGIRPAVIDAVHAAGGHAVVAADLLALTLLRRRASSAPTSPSARRSASACRWASAVRTRATWPCAPGWSASCRAASSASRRMPPATPPTGSSLQTREQHIRREKATSNICTAQVLLAVMAAMYAVYHGPGGLKRIAERVHERGRRRSPPSGRCRGDRSSTP